MNKHGYISVKFHKQTQGGQLSSMDHSLLIANKPSGKRVLPNNSNEVLCLHFIHMLEYLDLSEMDKL